MLVNHILHPDFQTARRMKEARKFRSTSLVTPKMSKLALNESRIQLEAALRGTAKGIYNLPISQEVFARVREVCECIDRAYWVDGIERKDSDIQRHDIVS